MKKKSPLNGGLFYFNFAPDVRQAQAKIISASSG